MDQRQRRAELVRWAEEVQLPPEGYRPLPALVDRAQFAVCVAENRDARPAERYAVCAARVSVLEGRENPLPGEPFTSYFSRSNIARREYERLRRTLG
jgi:hypothetical protein